MGRQNRLISTSILRAIFRTKSSTSDGEIGLGFFARVWAFFALFSLSLARYRQRLFQKLRNNVWHVEEEEYTESFRSPSKNKRTDLVAVGDLGYSGSVCRESAALASQNMANNFPKDFLYDTELQVSDQVAPSEIRTLIFQGSPS